MRVHTVLIVAFLLGAAASTASAQQSPFVGTWEEVAGLDAQGKARQARPAVVMFGADGFFTYSEIPPGRPKVNKPIEQMTREELVARFGGLRVRRGTYSLSGNTFTRVELADENPNLEGRMVNMAFRLEGDTLVLLSDNPQDKSEGRFRRARKP